MFVLKKIVDFYIESSIHVALAVYCLIQITYFKFQVPEDGFVSSFAFFGTILGYNFVKYFSILSDFNKPIKFQLKAIYLLSSISLIISGYCFFQFSIQTQLFCILLIGLLFLYAFPFFPKQKNARNWAGLKIYLVCLSWVGVTVFLPVLNAEVVLTSHFYKICLQRFILVFVLILVFEVIDLANDALSLQTVPQQIGLKKTKILGCILILFFCILEFLSANITFEPVSSKRMLHFLVSIVVCLFLIFANEKKSKYYSTFWVECVPIFWWAIICFFL